MSRLTVLIGLLLLTFFIHTHDLNITPPGMNYDAGYNLTHAQRISQGHGLPALIFDDRPEPMYRYLLAGWFTLVGDTEFAARLLQGVIGLVAVALTYRAGVLMFGRTAGLVAAGALAASMPHFFLSRSGYRAILLTPMIAASLICLWRARKTGRLGDWAGAGFFVGVGLNTYFAGLVLPFLMLGWIIHQKVIAPRAERIPWKGIGAMVAGFIPPLLVWAWTMTYVSNLWFRFNGASNIDTPLIERLLIGVPSAFAAYFIHAYHWMTLYIVPDSAFLNPVLAFFALIGLLLAVRRWRHADGAMLLGGVLIFTLPGALSELPTHPVRLMGAAAFLALLTGWGVQRIVRTFAVYDRYLYVGIGLMLIGSMGLTHTRYHDFFASPERYDPPNFWRNIPHNYSLPLWEAMQTLAQVDEPTYVPLNALDDRIAVFTLTGTTFPHVTTAARYGLTELPAGQVFYPAYDYLFNPAPERYPLMALLLPDEDTIVILPRAAGEIIQPEQAVMSARWDWVVAYVGEREASTLPPTITPPDAPILGGKLHLTNPYAVERLEPGAVETIIYEWEVLEPFGRDAFSFAQLLDEDQRLYATRDQYILQYLYPAQMWRPGDIIPNLLEVQLPLTFDEAAYHWTGGVWVSPRGQERLDVVSADGVYLDTRLYWGAARGDEPQAVTLPDDLRPLDAVLGEVIALDGYTAEQDGDMLTLTLYWRALRESPGDYTVFVHAMRGDAMIDQVDVRPSPPTYAWYEGEGFAFTYTLELTAEPDALYIGMYSYPSFARLSVVQDGVLREDGRVVVESD